MMRRAGFSGAPARNGERWLQAQVLELFRDEPRMVVLDVGGWTRLLLDQVPPARATALDVYAFEPTAA